MTEHGRCGAGRQPAVVALCRGLADASSELRADIDTARVAAAYFSFFTSR